MRDGPLGSLTRENTQLSRLPKTISRVYNEYLDRPGQALVFGALFLLLGFYLAGSLSTIFGAAAFWEPTIALVPLFVTERISRAYYMRAAHERSATLKLSARPHTSQQPRSPRVRRHGLLCRLNAGKVGFYLGICIDALKLAG